MMTVCEIVPIYSAYIVETVQQKKNNTKNISIVNSIYKITLQDYLSRGVHTPIHKRVGRSARPHMAYSKPTIA